MIVWLLAAAVFMASAALVAVGSVVRRRRRSVARRQRAIAVEAYLAQQRIQLLTAAALAAMRAEMRRAGRAG